MAMSPEGSLGRFKGRPERGGWRWSAIFGRDNSKQPSVSEGDFIGSEGSTSHHQSPVVGNRESLVSPERKVTAVRTVETRDFREILNWWSDDNTRKHLDPPPPFPEDDTPEELVRSQLEFQKYLINGGEPHKLLAVVGVNSYDKPLAFGAVRWRGHKEEVQYAGGRDITRVPFIERVTVNPELQVVNQVDNTGRDTGRRFNAGAAVASSLVDHIFKVGYSPRRNGEKNPQKSARIWVMVDVENPPIKFWEEKMGFRLLPGDYNQWKDEQRIRTDRGNAYKYEITAENWEKLKSSGAVDTSLILPIAERDIFSNGNSDLVRPL